MSNLWNVDRSTESPNTDGRFHGHDVYSGATLTFDGKPVAVPGNVTIYTFENNPRDRTIHAQMFGQLENGWGVDAMLNDGVLSLAGYNHREIERQRQLEETTPGRVGDLWDFEYTKTGYDNPGAYVQWIWFSDEEDPEYVGQWATVTDPDDLAWRIKTISGMSSDPTDQSGYKLTPPPGVHV